jgi:hypothetical protein
MALSPRVDVAQAGIEVLRILVSDRVLSLEQLGTREPIPSHVKRGASGRQCC